MASVREINDKINSIKKTRKITRAMELVAASKMRKAQDQMQTPRPYAEKIKDVAEHVARAHCEYHHPYLSLKEDLKRVGYIVVASDRGLCGSLNVNLFKKLLAEFKEWQSKGVEVDLCLIGQKAEHFFGRAGFNVIGTAHRLGDTPSMSDLIGVVKVMLDQFDEEKIDAIFLSYNKFINTMSQQATVDKLLPLLLPEEVDPKESYWDYIYEPDPIELLDLLLDRYIEAEVYQSVVENLACEQAARMVAMKSATDNAGQLIDELQLIYNKTRQAAITQEISEIVGGAAAV